MEVSALFEYKIKKRRAVKIEELPPKEMIEYKSFKYSRLNPLHEKKQANRHCVRCGREAVVTAFFKFDRKGTLVKEKYCNDCLQKWVYLPSSAELSGDTCYCK